MKHLILVPTAFVVALHAGCVAPSGDDAPEGPDGDPGGLPVPCNDGSHNTTPRCSSGIGVPAGSFGSGPSVKTMGSLPTIRQGFVEAPGRLVVAVDFNFRAAVLLGVDLETGDRTVLSGHYDDAAQGEIVVGEGQAFDQIFDVQPGPDGWYVASKPGVFRVDPATGDRTVVIDYAGDGPPGCEMPDADGRRHKPSPSSLAIGPDGTIYQQNKVFETWESGGPIWGGHAILAYRGGACTVVSRSNPGNEAEPLVGPGPRVFGDLTAMRYADDAISGVAFVADSLFDFQIADGARRRVSSPDASHPVGAGTAELGTSHIDDAGDAWLTSGGSGEVLTLVDKDTGDRTAVPIMTGPYAFQTASHGWKHPTKPWLVGVVEYGFVLIHPTNGDSAFFSY